MFKTFKKLVKEMERKFAFVFKKFRNSDEETLHDSLESISSVGKGLNHSGFTIQI